MVEPQSFSFSRKGQAVCVENQEDMNYDGTPVKAQLCSCKRRWRIRKAAVVRWKNEGEHRWTARDRTVIARMEQYLDENDNMRVEIEELEFLLGPEDSEVDLRQILRYARRKKGGRIFDIFSSKGQSEFLVASRRRWDERQRVLVTQEEESRRKAQEVDYEVNQNWTAVNHTIAIKILSYLDLSEASKVSTRELKEQVLSPNEPSVNIERIARQARSEKRKKLFQIFSRQGANEIFVSSMARAQEHLRMFIVLERNAWMLAKRLSTRARNKKCWLLRWRARRLCRKSLLKIFRGRWSQ